MSKSQKSREKLAARRAAPGKAYAPGNPAAVRMLPQPSAFLASFRRCKSPKATERRVRDTAAQVEQKRVAEERAARRSAHERSGTATPLRPEPRVMMAPEPVAPLKGMTRLVTDPRGRARRAVESITARAERWKSGGIPGGRRETAALAALGERRLSPGECMQQRADKLAKRAKKAAKKAAFLAAKAQVAA